MGVLYHLRHPLLALELLHEHVVADLLVAQSLLRGSKEDLNLPGDFPFWEQEIFERDEFPRMYFVEHRFANDPTNWWIPNRSGFLAMLRSAGFEILDQPEDEVFICRRTELRGPLNYLKELREITR
jgi:tRNA (mo5U34)-methyltransferase